MSALVTELRPCGNCGHLFALHWDPDVESLACTRPGCGCVAWWSMENLTPEQDTDDPPAEGAGPALGDARPEVVPVRGSLRLWPRMLALVLAAERACEAMSRLDADATEGVPIWELDDADADAEVRELLAARYTLMAAVDEATGCGWFTGTAPAAAAGAPGGPVSGGGWAPAVWVGRDVDPPVTGIAGDRWHAVARVYTPRVGEGAECGTAVCGDTVTVAARFGAFDPDRFPGRTCHGCTWRVAIRADTLTDQLRRLAATEGDPFLAARVAEAVIAAEATDHDRDHPHTVQLLAAVSAHAPTAMLSPDCGDGDCEHPRHEPCPTVALACMACSQRAGSWAGEFEGICLPEATIPAPCEVLRTLAAHYGLVGGRFDPPVERCTVHARRAGHPRGTGRPAGRSRDARGAHRPHDVALHLRDRTEPPALLHRCGDRPG